MHDRTALSLVSIRLYMYGIYNKCTCYLLPPPPLIRAEERTQWRYLMAGMNLQNIFIGGGFQALKMVKF